MFPPSQVFRVLMIKVAGKAEEPPKAAFAGGKMHLGFMFGCSVGFRFAVWA